MSILKINTDGGSRGNPGPGASAFVVCDESGEVVHKHGLATDLTTNNKAEYLAALMAIEWLSNAKLTDVKKVEFFLDSELVVKQLNGIYKIKDKDLLDMAIKIKSFKDKLPYTVTFTHVRREQNKLADQLVNETLDTHLQHV